MTAHAVSRTEERSIDHARLLDLIESGETRYKDLTRLWIHKEYPDRNDNRLCAAVLLTEHVLIVKTVMHRFEIT